MHQTHQEGLPMSLSLPRPACPAPSSAGFPLERTLGAGHVGGAGWAGPGAGRGAASRRSSSPPGLGSRWLVFPSSPALAMEDERKDGAYGRSCLWPAATSAELGGVGGGGRLRS